MRCLATFFLLAGFASAQESPMTIELILARVQNHTGQFEQTLPDFVCDEKIVSKAVHRGKAMEDVAESHFVGLQKKSGVMSFTESREIVSQNGKLAKPGERLRGPFLFGGGFSSVLNQTFAPKFVSSHTYKFAGEESVADRPALVIEFATNEGQTKLFFDLYGKAVVQKDVGKAWIDKESSHVLRLERHYLNVSKGLTPLIAIVEYGEVKIDGKPFWMPVSVRATQDTLKGSEQGEYYATYTNYRKFAVSSGIVFDAK